MSLESPDSHQVYEAAVMGLFAQELGSHLTPALKAQLTELGIDVANPQPGYPVRVVDAGTALMVRELFGDLDPDEGFRRMGHLQVLGFARTRIGWAAFALLRLFSRRRQLERIAGAWRKANNFVETRLTTRSGSEYELWVNDVGRYPEVTAGILEAALGQLGPAPRVRVLGRDGLSATYLLQFELPLPDPAQLY